MNVAFWCQVQMEKTMVVWKKDGVLKKCRKKTQSRATGVWVRVWIKVRIVICVTKCKSLSTTFKSVFVKTLLQNSVLVQNTVIQQTTLWMHFAGTALLKHICSVFDLVCITNLADSEPKKFVWALTLLKKTVAYLKHFLFSRVQMQKKET